MARRTLSFGVIMFVLFCSFFLNPGISQALPFFGIGDGILKGNWTWANAAWNGIGSLGVTQRSVVEKISWTNQVQVVSGDFIFQKVSLSLPCDFDWGPASFTMNCTDGTNTVSANYEVAFIETSQTKSKKEQVMMYVWGNYNANLNGVQKTGGVSASLLSGTEKKDNSGNLISTILSGTIYGAIDNDSTFQVKVRFTLIPM